MSEVLKETKLQRLNSLLNISYIQIKDRDVRYS